MGVRTQYDIGIRRSVGALGAVAALGERNFEPELAKAGTIAYQVKFGTATGLWWVDGNTYTRTQTLPYDVSSVSYSAQAISLLNFYWEQDWISPTT